MKVLITKTSRYLLKVLLGIIFLIVLYLIFAYIFSVISVNRNFKETENGIDIFIQSNGVHTDIVVPASNELKDWRKKINPEDFKKNESEVKYISFGWGDKGFYLYTPTWNDLKFSTAFKAIFWLSTSAMHVSYFENTPIEDKHIKKIRISRDQYQKLIQHIENSFEKDSNGDYILIKANHSYGINDNFYEAEGTYNLFETCNNWTNSGLKKAGVKTALWAPFEWSVMQHRNK